MIKLHIFVHMWQLHTFKALQNYKFLGSFLIFTAIALALYVHIGKFWHLSTNFSLLNFTKTPGQILNVHSSKGDLSYLIGYKSLTKTDTIKLAHHNYFTDHFEKGDTLSIYISKQGIRVPKVDGMDHYIWFLLFCFGISTYVAAIFLKRHLFRPKP